MKTHTTKPIAAVNQTPVVTQAMLAEYEQLRRLEQVREEKQREIINLLESVAAVEKGPRVARLDTCERVMCSWQKLDELLGTGEVEYLRSQIEPSVATSLKVTQRGAKTAKQ